MITLIDNNANRIILENRCNSITTNRVAKSVFKIVKSSCGGESNQQVTLDTQESISFVDGKQTTFDLKISSDNYTELEYTLLLTPNYTIESHGTDYIEGSNILNDYLDSDSVYVNDIEYTINKVNSTQNKIYVNRPFNGAVVNILVPIKTIEYLFPVKPLLVKLESIISGINNTYNCDVIDKGIDYTLKFMGLSSALKCCDKKKALEIYRFLIT